jgi:hypothetical protein
MFIFHELQSGQPSSKILQASTQEKLDKVNKNTRNNLKRSFIIKEVSLYFLLKYYSKQ